MEAFKPNHDSPESADQQYSGTEPQSKQGCPPTELMDLDDCQGQQGHTPSESALQAELANLKAQLQEKTLKLKELQDKCDMMSQDAITKDQDITKFRKLWKKAATEHDKFRASGQGFYQITDEYLVELINHLRLNIRDLSIQYFDGIAPKGDPLTVYQPHYFNHLNNTTKGYMRYLKSPTRSHEVVQAFLWRVIFHEIFEKFEWLGADTSDDFRHLRYGLKPPLLENPQGGPPLPNHEAERKFHSWSSTTISMLLTSIDAHKANNHMKHRIDYHIKRIINTVAYLLRKDKERSFENQLSAIITEAFALDKEISRQVARVIWRFSVPQQEENADHPHAALGKPGLVMAPAVFKRGKSTGEGFDHETKLLDIVEGSK
ncbi:hypothetical protein FANTH_1576 [Fusarium anthophilum]|uniref:Uncharacterized protein n=1 Tax=Fusarium anthophilum TaxID=48485 RepID=A0A8H5EAU6_9HYPO|nr:hypothetical protein FANTH_1576 [Fusarium anthophilum]